jgi:hypothetical protein
MSSTCNPMHMIDQVEDPTSLQRASTSLNLMKIERNIIRKLDIMKCKLEAFYLALAYIKHEIAWIQVQGKDREEYYC